MAAPNVPPKRTIKFDPQTGQPIRSLSIDDRAGAGAGKGRDSQMEILTGFEDHTLSADPLPQKKSCKAPGCNENHAQHYCNTCKNADANHRTKNCPMINEATPKSFSPNEFDSNSRKFFDNISIFPVFTQPGYKINDHPLKRLAMAYRPEELSLVDRSLRPDSAFCCCANDALYAGNAYWKPYSWCACCCCAEERPECTECCCNCCLFPSKQMANEKKKKLSNINVRPWKMNEMLLWSLAS